MIFIKNIILMPAPSLGRSNEKSIVAIEGGKIAGIHNRLDIPESAEKVIDGKGLYLSAGFIDIHTHGGGGHDFMDGAAEAFKGAARLHAEHGTTSLVPTTLTSTLDELEKTFGVFRKAKTANHWGANLLGLHLEGPYFAMSQKGAQDPRYIKDPDENEYKSIIDMSDDIIRWSSAPERKGALEFGRYLAKHDILPSIGHSDAVYEEVKKAFECGYTHITHLYSAMSTVKRINSYRYAGIVEAAYLIDGMTVEIIADGAHLPASLLKLVYKIKGADKAALVTDSMRAAGMPEGKSILGSLKDGQEVIVEDGVAKLPDRAAFAGSVATADRLVRTMHELAEIPLAEAIKMMTAAPANIIGIGDKKGSVIEGYDADMVIFDKDIDIKTTIVGGRLVYNKLQ